MYFYRCIPVITVICVLLSGCSLIEETAVSPKRMVSSYYEEIVKTDKPLELDLAADSANIEVYSWDKKEVKFEITKKVRGTQTREELEKMLNGFNISCTGENGRITFKSEYKGPIRSTVDISIDLKVYIPKKITSVNCKLDIGRIRIYDDMKGSLNVAVNMANVDINKFEGKLNLNADMCDLRIGSGMLADGSLVNVNMGNILINARYEKEGRYNFHTGMGNIDITAPAEQKISFESIGCVDINQFESGSFPVKIELRSGMGKIAIKKSGQ